MPTIHTLRSRLARSPATWILAFATLAVLSYSLWILPGGYDAAREAVVSSLLIILIDVLSASLALRLAACRNYEVKFRQGWGLLAAATLSHAIAESIWFYLESIVHTEPFPSVADVFYLIYYPLTLAGVLRFLAPPSNKQERAILWLDLGIVVVTSWMLYWHFILEPLQHTSSTWFEGLVAIAYPVGDLIILAGLSAFIQRDMENLTRWTLFFLGVGIAVITLADTIFALLEVNNREYLPGPLNSLWMIGTLAQLAAATFQLNAAPGSRPIEHYQSPHQHNLLRVAFPYLVSAIGGLLLLLVIYSATSIPPSLRGLVDGAIVLIILVLLRQYIILIDNIRLYRDMERMATTDGLTRVFNRHYFNQRFQQEFERARRYNKPLSILLIDVDEFKMYNDSFGHLQGDVVLQMIAETLTRKLRSTDFLARFGGDEFVIILPETAAEGSRAVKNKIQQAVAAQKFHGKRLSITVGMTSLAGNLTPEQMIEAADRDLYHQKENSRPLPSPGNLAAG